MIPAARRGTGFGLFYGIFGVGWFLGSMAMGFIYNKSIIALITFSVISQLAALLVFIWGTTQRSSR